MRTIIKLTFIVSALLILQSCQKDPLNDIEEGGWNNERSVIDIKFKGQIGNAVIENTDSETGRIEFSANMAAVTDLSKVEIEKLDISYQGKVSIQTGTALDFNNAGRSANITVTSPTGKDRIYTVYMNEFDESLVGTWSISSMALYGGVEDSWWRTGLLTFGADNDYWADGKNNPGAEYDNTLTLTLEGADNSGNTYGTCVHSAGADGKYADFVFAGSQNGKNPGVDVDMTDTYRKIPKGTSKWIRNYSAGTVTFTDEAGKEYVAAFESAGTIQLSDLDASSANDVNITIPEHAFSFTYPLAWDYFSEYSVYAKVVLNPRKFFILVNKID
ncbi:hypothetical protein D0T84_03530 [Dysgonomonas sp. 521]|uniref:hypothetical protein n=1 Tax=Dysgonomonas sp. 521 TaxID=2302932 RepID=UPI0013D61173|nr:hypothetical protein [Dysgonomonas sp. 521]NDV93989.1 hypothetical protein [Dysgonomonas sp. 521]